MPPPGVARRALGGPSKAEPERGRRARRRAAAPLALTNGLIRQQDVVGREYLARGSGFDWPVPDLGSQVGVTVLDALLKARQQGVLEAVSKIFSKIFSRISPESPGKRDQGRCPFGDTSPDLVFSSRGGRI